MDKNKIGKNKKFNFISMEELQAEEAKTDSNETISEQIDIIETPVTVKGSSLDEVVESDTINEVDDKQIKELYHENVKRKIYFGFETRVAFLIITIIVLFCSACYMIVQAFSVNNNERVSYLEISDVNYEVCLLDNSCVGEGLNYTNSSIKSVNSQFRYQTKYDKKLYYDLGYEVLANFRVYDAVNKTKVNFEKEDVLVPLKELTTDGNDLDFKVSTTVDFASYNRMLYEYLANNNQYSSANVEVSLYINEFNEMRKVSSVTIPLGVDSLGISKGNTYNGNKFVLVKSDSWNEYNTVCAIFATLLFIMMLIILFRTTKLVAKVTKKKNTYYDKLNSILTDYDRLIVIARDGYESNIKKKIIKVNSFEELLEARDVLEKPIIYSPVNDIKCEFIVEDDEKLYKYVLKEADL